MKKVIILLIVVVGIGIIATKLRDLQSLPQPKNVVTVLSPMPSTTAKGGDLPFPLTVPNGYSIGLFASNLGTARDMEFTDGGTLLVSNPSNNTVTALRDTNNDGQADTKKIVVNEGNVVHGLAMHKGKLYIALKNSLERYSWDENTQIATHEKRLLSYPGSTNHVNRTLVFGADNKIYISLGSNCNVCNESEPWEGTVIVAQEDGSNAQLFAKGQRNAPFLALNPSTHEVWATGMGRDFLGDDIPPDEINILKDGQDYGWPRCYGDRVHDTSFDKSSTNPCAETKPPVYQIAAHSAPLGLAFVPEAFSTNWQNDIVVAYHGSWNRSTPIGYKVVHITTRGNAFSEEDLVTGFRSNGDVLGRPADVIFDRSGNLYISDDKAGNIYIISH